MLLIVQLAALSSVDNFAMRSNFLGDLDGSNGLGTVSAGEPVRGSFNDEVKCVEDDEVLF